MLAVLLNSCKNIARVEIDEIWGRAVKVAGECKSTFSTFARILNTTPGIEATIDEWCFRVFSGDNLLLELNNFNFNVSVSKPVNFMNGNLVIKVGLPYFDAFIDYVDKDVFQGQTPDRLHFSCSVIDMDGHISNLTASTTLEYYEKNLE